jgi:hypothetical protein
LGFQYTLSFSMASSSFLSGSSTYARQQVYSSSYVRSNISLTFQPSTHSSTQPSSSRKYRSLSLLPS